MNGKEEEKDARASFSDNRHSQNGHTPSEKKAAKEVVSEPPPPAKPDNHTLLAEVREILNPDGRRWPDAHYIKKNFSFHMAEKVAGYIVTNAEDIELPEVATSAPREELVKAVAYVMWGAA